MPEPRRESLRTRLLRVLYNFIPAYRGTGGRITFIADDFTEIRVRVPLNWRTRNYVGTIFGGSMFGAVDPLYMVMLIRTLGPGYVVWDKSAAIRFRKPGRAQLRARCALTGSDLDEIRDKLESIESIERSFTIDLTDENGEVCATVTKLIHIKKRSSPVASRAESSQARF